VICRKLRTATQPNKVHDGAITHLPVDVVEELPSFVSPVAVVISADSQQSQEIVARAVKAYKMLQEQWGCNTPGHDICLRGINYIGHIQLSEEQVSVWVGEICRGHATCLYFPDVIIIPDGTRSNRDSNFDWGGSGTSHDANVEIGPGYFCGLFLERIGATILYRAKVLMLARKLWMYDRIVHLRSASGARIPRPPHNRVSPRFFGIIVQETVDLMRTSYPLYIRKRASGIFGVVIGVDLYKSLYGEVDCTRIMLQFLGHAFNHFGGTSSKFRMSSEITSSLYKSLTRAPLHIHWSEVASTFIIILCRYLAGSWQQPRCGFDGLLVRLVMNSCALRQLSPNELNAIHGYLEYLLCNRKEFYNRDSPYFLLQYMRLSKTCSKQDARFKILSEVLLDASLDITVGARSRHNALDHAVLIRAEAVRTYFANRVMLIDDTDKIDRVASFLVFHLSYISTQDNWGWIAFYALTHIIKVIITLIAATPDPESSCTEVRAENVVNAFVKLIPHFNALDVHSDELEDFSKLKAVSYSLLCLISTPFTGPSFISNSCCRSVLEEK